MIPGLLTVGSAIAKVGLSGLLGFFKNRQAMKQAAQNHAFEMEMLEKQAVIQERLGAMRLEETQAQSEAQVLTAAVQAEAQEGVARQKSYMAEGKGVSRWVNDLRGATRPGITWVLVGAVIYLTATGSDFEQQQLIPVIVAITETAAGFWFGGRFTQAMNGTKK